jgi:hypothetical protein
MTDINDKEFYFQLNDGEQLCVCETIGSRRFITSLTKHISIHPSTDQSLIHPPYSHGNDNNMLICIITLFCRDI